LNILIMGDSVGAHQIGKKNLEASGTSMTHLVQGMPYPNNHIAVTRTKGGSVAASYRTNGGMLSEELLRNGPLGVSAHHVLALKNYLFTHSNSSDIDVVILFIPAGWIGTETEIVNAVNLKSLAESVRMAGSIFGAETVILSTIPVSNNIFRLEKNLIPVNRLILRVAKQYREETFDNPGERLGRVKMVMALDLGKYTMHLVYANALSMGLVKHERNDYAITNVSIGVLDEILHSHVLTTTTHNGKEILRPMALQCKNLTKTNKSSDCPRNAIYVDGMHLCMKNVAGRIQAGIACLISCAYPQVPSYSLLEVSDCEQLCNEKYMSVAPLTV